MARIETFDARNVMPSAGFDPLPPGWYQATITKADLTPTKDGTGQYIKVRYDILGPTHQGRVVFGNLNLRNANPKAEEIGRQQLGDVCRAIGKMQLSDTDELLGGVCEIKLTIRTQEGYEPQNEVKGWKAIAGGVMPTPEIKHETAPAAKATPPWAKR